jgi:hypothetical protein
MHRANIDSTQLIAMSTQLARVRAPRHEFKRLKVIDSAITSFSERQFGQKRYVTLSSHALEGSAGEIDTSVWQSPNRSTR